jgi:hypothetical protein
MVWYLVKHRSNFIFYNEIYDRQLWCYITVPNVGDLSQNKSDNTKDRSYKELEHVFDLFHKYHMEILLGDFNAKEEGDHIFKPITGNESLHEIGNDRKIMS